jgi:signal transduction histidine kinase/streptogramin lyase
MHDKPKARLASAHLILDRVPRLYVVTVLILCFGVIPRCRAIDSDNLIAQLTHTSWTASDGIPGTVRAIAQTPDGYLWLGTEAGLYRFDGLHFLAWEPTGGERMPSSSVLALCVSHDGSLWIGFTTGVISRLSEGQLKNFIPASGSPRGKILSIAEDSNGAIWAAGQYAFGKIENGEWQRMGANEGYLAPAAQYVLVDRSGNVWVATDGYDFALRTRETCIWRVCEIDDKVRRNAVLTLSKGANRFRTTRVPVGFVPQMGEAPDGSIWVADASNLSFIRISSETGQISIVQKWLYWPFCVLFDRNNAVWIGLDRNGLRRLNDFRNPEIPLTDRFMHREGLSGDTVYSGLQDREGNIWFGTDGGLDRFTNSKVTWFSPPRNLSHGQLLGLTSTADGSVWMFEYSQGGVHRYLEGRSTTSRLPGNGTQSSILSFYAENSRTIWVGGEFGLGELLDGHLSLVTIPGTLPGTVEAINKATDGSLWISMWGTDSIERPMRLKDGLWTDFRKIFALPNYRCRVVQHDSAGLMWLGYEDGEVAVYENDTFKTYSAKDGLIGGQVNTIFEDSKKRIWVGGDGGLSRFDDGHFETLTMKNGLPGHSVSGVLEDDDGFFWLAGSMGILRTDSRELNKAIESGSYIMQGTFLDARDGLHSMPRQREPFPVVTRTPDGWLWFSTVDGLATLDPLHLLRNLAIPPVKIEEISADGKSFSSTTEVKITLRPNTKTLQFRYTALSLTAPERVRFRYKLEGFDPDWRGPVTTREITYTNLPPRNYRFWVIACNNDGVWNEQGAAVDFVIPPTFTQTSTFKLLCLAALVCSFWLVFRFRMTQLTQQLRARMYARASEREQIARDLHDTFFQSIQGLLLRFNTAASRLDIDHPVRRVFDEALKQSDQVMAEGRELLVHLHAASSKANDLPATLADYGEQLRKVRSVDFKVAVNGDIRPLHPVILEELSRIGNEALGNAFRHSMARSIEAELSYEAKELRMRIRDNGSGIDGSIIEEGRREGHLGLVSMRERAKNIGAKLDLWSRPKGGTEIELRIPANLAYESGAKGKPRRRFWRKAAS